MKLVKNIVASLIFACGLVSIVVAEMAPKEDAHGRKIEGTWDMQITLTDCAGHVIRSFPSLVTFMSGGTVMESNAGTPQALKTPGEGVWRHATDQSYEFSFKFFTFNAQNVFTGWTIIAGETTVDRSGDVNTGSATVNVYDPNGVLLISLCAETAGKRFEL